MLLFISSRVKDALQPSKIFSALQKILCLVLYSKSNLWSCRMTNYVMHLTNSNILSLSNLASAHFCACCFQCCFVIVVSDKLQFSTWRWYNNFSIASLSVINELPPTALMNMLWNFGCLSKTKILEHAHISFIMDVTEFLDISASRILSIARYGGNSEQQSFMYIKIAFKPSHAEGFHKLI